MGHSPYLISTAEALQRVFVPSVRPSPKLSLRPRRVSLHPFTYSAQRQASTRPKPGAFNLAGKFVSSAKSGPQSSPSNLYPRDEAINSSRIHLVQPDSKLSAPQSLLSLLRTIDRKTHYVEQHDEFEGLPVCKLINKAEARAAEKARRKAKAKNPSQTVKYLELNWAIDQNDLQHRLGKLKEFLLEGRRVEVFLAKKKKRMRDATEAEGRSTLARLREFVRTIEGARETRDMDGKFLERATLFFEGKRSKQQGGEADEAATELVNPEGKTMLGQDAGTSEEDQQPQQVAYG